MKYITSDMKHLHLFFFIGALLISTVTMAQDQNNESESYFSIGNYPEEFNACSVLKRLVDGLGYRYYWATDSLGMDDLNYRSSPDSRTSFETLQHIEGLSYGINCFFSGKAVERRPKTEDPDWASLRQQTLDNIRSASDQLAGMNEEQLFELKVRFKRNDSESEFAFWHIINGQISDALWHVGQIVSNRRASGNPLDPRVSVFMGKIRE